MVYTSQTVEERESTERLKVTVGIQTNEISTSATEVCAGETVEMSVSGNSIENNYSLDFPNTAQYSGNAKAVCSSNLADLNITGDFTIEFYIKAEGSYYWHLMGKNTFGNNSQGWLIKKPSTSLSFAWTYNPNEFNFYQPNFGQWEHIAISFDDVSNTFRVFQDGVMVTSEVRDININSSNYDFVIGHELGTGNWFDGKLDNLRISNVSRYTSNFNPSQTFMADASTIAMFDFNEGSGSQAQDISGNGRNLTLYNTNYDTDVPSGSQASYTWSTGETTATISVTLTETTDYWVDVTSKGVTNRETITITVNTTAVPAGDATQSFDIAATVADLSASGENLQWYDAATDGNLLDSTTALTNGQVVYASQTLDGCESTERLTVKISLQSSNLEYPIWELLNPLSELPKANFNFLPYSFDKENRLIYLLNVKENWIYSYQIDTNIFTPIQANNYPSFDNSGSFVFNPSRQTLQFWRSGTDNVYEISTNGGNIIQIGNGSFNAQLYGSDAIYNGVTTNPALMNGYGYFTQKNAAYELLKGIWEEKRGNSGNQPFKRGTIIYPNEDFTKAYIIDGIGNASGNQTESSCSTEGALPWATDVGKYCWLRDLWEIDLSDWSVRSILPLNSNFTTTGSFGYDYENNKFYSFGGFTPPTYYGQELEWNNTLRIFNPNSQSGWIDIEQYGDIPPIGKSYVSYYDLQLNRFIVCSSQGIWALNLSENSGSLSNKEFELQDKIRVYPNPTKNKLFIQGLPNPSKISIYNVLGESVVSETNSKEIDVKKLPLGIYILKVIYNEKETVHKFIKN